MSEPGKELTAELDKIGIKGLDLWSRPLRQITNSKLPITKPEDLKGMKLRVPNNPLWVEFFGAMGAAPTPMAFAEVYNALQLRSSTARKIRSMCRSALASSKCRSI